MVDSEFLEELEAILIQADVGINTTERLLSGISERLKESRQREASDEEVVLRALKDEIVAVLGPPEPLRKAEEGPTVIMVVGVNGTGKTTTVGKLGHRFRAQGADAVSYTHLILDKERLESDLVEQLRKVELENAKLQAVQAERQREFDKSRQRVEMLRSQLGSDVRSLPSQDDEGEELEKRYQELTASAENLRQVQAEVSNRIKELSSARDEAMRDITGIKVRIAKKGQEAENLKTQIAALEKSVFEVASELSLIHI